MEVYTAQIDAMDQGIGRILAALEDTGQLENTLVIFLADNGGCAEEISAQWASWLVARGRVARGQTRDGRPVRIGNDPAVMPGGEDTYQSCGVPWANLSNTPFRYYKHWTHEGGIATPFIVHWPAGLAARGELRHQPAYLPDVMATVLELTGAAYPATVRGNPVPPCEGTSLVPAFDNHELARVAPMCWEHEGNAALRDGRWKLVRNFTGQRSATPGFDPPGGRGDWELYDLATDRSERHDLAAAQPERVAAMVAAYEAWAARCGVRDRAWYLEFQRRRRA
jgi:arylsulfatase